MDWELMADLRGELQAINKTLVRIAEGIERNTRALETFNNAAIRDLGPDREGHIEVFATTHEG